ncbi:MAG TPA: hypothetical protein DHH42_00640 [Clostridiales bacterium]|nr:hypothetical protein [Clostridiales bacterium]
MEFLYETIAAVTWQQVIMWCLGARRKKESKPSTTISPNKKSLSNKIPRYFGVFYCTKNPLNIFFARGII